MKKDRVIHLSSRAVGIFRLALLIISAISLYLFRGSVMNNILVSLLLLTESLILPSLIYRFFPKFYSNAIDSHILMWFFVYPILFGAGAYFISVLAGYDVNFIHFSWAALAFSGMVQVASWVFLFSKEEERHVNWRAQKSLLIVLFISLITIVSSGFAYKYLPAADGYLYMRDLGISISTGMLTYSLVTRPVFYGLSLFLSSITGLGIMDMFKWLMPIYFAFGFTIVSYRLATRLGLTGLARIVCALLPMAIPAVFQDALVTRPNNFAILSAFTLVYFMTFLGGKKVYKNEIFFLLSLLGVSLIGQRMHELYIISSFVLTVFLSVRYWIYCRQNGWKYIAIPFVSILLLFPWLEKLGITNLIVGYSHNLWQLLSHCEWRAWFLDGYKNVDGTWMSWQGWGAVQYYVFSLGVVSTFAIIINLFMPRKNTSINSEFSLIPLSAYLLTTFFIAEMIPRIGIAYLPERMIVFFGLLLCPVAVLAVVKITNATKKGALLLLLTSLLIVSLIGNVYLTFLRGGWFTNHEIEAAEMLKNEYPNRDIVLSQQSTYSLIEYFAAKNALSVPSGFFTTTRTPAEQDVLIDTLVKTMEEKEYLSEDEKKELDDLFNEFMASENNKQRADALSKLDEYTKPLTFQKRTTLALLEAPKRPGVYIFFSGDQFKTFNARNASWREINGENANLEQFRSNPRLSEIYHKDDIIIWRYTRD